jgi:E3 ubiquitin-protein ligase MYCBP2
VAAGYSSIGGGGSVLRKRNSSHEEHYYHRGASSSTAEFLAHTSPAWKRLFDAPPNDLSIAGKLAESPVIGFLLQWNDLEAVRLAMQFSLRKAVCRVYALQAFNWLLRSVSQPVCLHDLLWCLVSALQQQRGGKQPPLQAACGNCAAAADPVKKEDVPAASNIVAAAAAASVRSDDENAAAAAVAKERDDGFEHPMSDLCLVGGAVRTLPSTFHALLQTISGWFFSF